MNTINLTIIYNNIKTLAKKLNIRMSEIEEAAGVSPGYMSRLAQKNGDTANTALLGVIASASKKLSVSIESILFSDLSSMSPEEEKMLQFIYNMDGGTSPSNLFPSIHCYVSWLCYRGLNGAKEIPKWYQNFSLVFAVLVIISTQVLKQHYVVDAVAGIALVEIAWRFYNKKSRYQRMQHFFEKLNGIILKI